MMRNWNVCDLLHRRGGKLTREKTLKTSTSSIPSAYWNVNGLLDRLPDDIDKRHDRRRFHQLFHRLRHTKDSASSAGWTHDLEHVENLLRNREVERCEKVHQLFYHLRCRRRGAKGPPALGRRSAPRCAAVLVPAAAPQATVLAARRLVPLQRPPRRPSRSAGHQPPGGWDVPELGRAVQLVPTPRPLPSPGAVRCGADTRQGPLRRSDVRA